MFSLSTVTPEETWIVSYLLLLDCPAKQWYKGLFAEGTLTLIYTVIIRTAGTAAECA